MNYDLSEEQESVRDLAARILGDRATADRVKEIEAGEERVDRALWSELASAGLLGVCLPESAGGAGLDLMTLVLLLEQQGRRVAPIPLLPTIAAAMSLADAGADVASVIAGESFVAPAIWEAHAADPYRPTTTPAIRRLRGSSVDSCLTGSKPSVMGAHVADRLVVTARDGVYVVDPRADGVTLERAIATSREVVTHVRLEGAPAERIGDVDALHRLVDVFTLGLCALTIGVCEEANAQAAEYTSNRHQFGKPLSTFQGTAHKAADSYIDTEALRVVTWQAAWRMDRGRDDAEPALLAAKWHATEAGHLVTHRTQHLHGGMGADIDYPVHRYFQWGKQLATTLGGATETLARLGDVLVGAHA